MSDPHAQPAPAVATVDVGDGLLLFDRERVRAHGLNASATLVWRAIEADAHDAGVPDTRQHVVDLEAVVRRVGHALAPDDAPHPPDPVEGLRAQIVEVVAHLEREGLVAPGALGSEPAGGTGAADPAAGEPGSVPRAGGFANVPFTDEPAPPFDDVEWAHRGGPYRGLDVRFRVACDDADLGAYLAAALAPLRVDEGRDGDEQHDESAIRSYEVVLDAATGPGRAPGERGRELLVLDRMVVGRPGSPRSLAALVLWHINQLVSETSSQWLLHASAIVPAGSRAAVIFPAHRNSGKSTLVAALVAEGHRYVTDETVAVDLHSGDAIPYPKAIALDPGSWPLLPAFEPAHDPRLDRFEHDKWYCDVEVLHPGASVRHPVPVGAIVFPTFDPSRPTALSPLPPLEAALALAANSFNLAVVGEAGLAALARLAESVPAFRLSTCDVPSALAALQPVLTDPTQPRR